MEPVVSSKASFPIDFSLRNQDEQEVLYIDDIGETLSLVITNTSPTFLVLPLSPSNQPFTLRFRPGALVEDGKKVTLNTKFWRMSQGMDREGLASLSFAYLGPQLRLDPGKSLTIPLENVMAAAGGGARGTRVELLYKNVYSGENKTKLEGSRVLHMAILNRHGRAHLPLNVGFVETNRVVNDGQTASALLLRITNTLKRDPEYPERSTITLRAGEDAPTKLVFTFVAGPPEMEWALGTPDQVGKIIVGGRAPEGDMGASFSLGSPGTARVSAAGVRAPQGDAWIDRALGGAGTGAAGEARAITPGTIEKGFIRPVEKMEAELPTRGGSGLSGVSFGAFASGPPDERGAPAGVSVVGEQAFFSQPQSDWVIRQDWEGETPQWVLSPLGGTPVELEAGEYLQFYFSNIMTAHPSGLTNLYVYYQNIPGYWDGQFICTIEKTRGAVPRGAILLWYGEEVPAGWTLCDGSQGTPTLRDPFPPGEGEGTVRFLMKL